MNYSNDKTICDGITPDGIGPDEASLAWMGYPNYKISKKGEVFKYENGGWQFKKPHLSRQKKMVVRINDPIKIIILHTTVMKTFVGDMPRSHFVVHENGDVTDNSLVNLRWVKRIKLNKRAMSEEALIEEYITKRKSCPQISKETGIPTRTIHSWLIHYKIPRRQGSDYDLIDMTGKRIGNLVVIARAEQRKGHQASWVLHCQCCDIKFVVPGWKVRHRQIGGCRECGKHPNFRGFGDIYATYWNTIRAGAISRNLEVTVTLKDIWELYLQQDGKCAYTGQPIYFPRSLGRKKTQTASLDRIDSSQGYIPGNIQWVHKDINTMKWDLSDKEFISICKIVAEYRKDS